MRTSWGRFRRDSAGRRAALPWFLLLTLLLTSIAVWACSGSTSSSPGGESDGSADGLQPGADATDSEAAGDATIPDSSSDTGGFDAGPDTTLADSGADALSDTMDATDAAGERADGASNDAASLDGAAPDASAGDADAGGVAPSCDAGRSPDAGTGLCDAIALGSDDSNAFLDGDGHVVAGTANPVIEPGVAAYWLGGYGCVAATPLDGGATVNAGGGCSSCCGPTALAVGPGSFYYIDPDLISFPSCYFGIDAISRVSASGSTLVCGNGSGSAGAVDIAVDATNAYWVGGGVWKIPLTGGTAIPLSTGGSPTSIAVDATSAYWVDGAAGAVMSVPIGGGTPVTIAGGLSGARGLRIDATSVYWLETGSGSVRKAPLAGGPATTLASCQSDLTGIGLDSDNVYWSSTTGSPANVAVYRVPLAGGVPTLLASFNPVTGGVVFGGEMTFASDIATDGKGNVFLVTNYQYSSFSYLGNLWKLDCAGH